MAYDVILNGSARQILLTFTAAYLCNLMIITYIKICKFKFPTWTLLTSFISKACYYIIFENSLDYDKYNEFTLRQ